MQSISIVSAVYDKVVPRKSLLMFLGSRQMHRMPIDAGHQVGRGRVWRLMRKMGLMAVFHKPRTSESHPEHKI